MERAANLGGELFTYYSLASMALDHLRHHGQRVDMIDAWLPVGGDPTEDPRTAVPWRVFLATHDDPPRLAYVVNFPSTKPVGFEHYDPPQDLGDGLRQMFQAQRTALAAIPKPKGPIDRIVLTGDALNAKGLLVYLLADSPRVGDVTFGKHYRVVVDFDGRTVRAVNALSSTDAVGHRLEGESQSGADSPGLSTVDEAVDWPQEIHVFESLKNGDLPIEVRTAQGIWRITGRKIELF